MKILDLSLQYETIKSEIDEAIHNVIMESSFILGEEGKKLEQKVAKFSNTKYAVGLNSGSDALLFALRAYDIGYNDEVITTPFSFIATAEVVILEGAKPIFIDIDPQTFNIDTAKIESKITENTKAIMPVHLYGQPADMDPIMRIAEKHNLLVIEDAAQAIGATYSDHLVGGIGDIGCFSFFPAKNLGAFGDGGMITTNDEKISEAISMMRNHGSKKKYYHEFIGDSSRLDNIQAAILNVKMKYIKQWNEQRRLKAEMYNKLLKNGPAQTPVTISNAKSIYQQYTIRLKNRDKVKEVLQNNDIQTAIHYPLPLHLQPSIKNLNLGYEAGDFPEAELACKEVLSLPIYPEISDSDIEKVANIINQN